MPPRQEVCRRQEVGVMRCARAGCEACQDRLDDYRKDAEDDRRADREEE